MQYYKRGCHTVYDCTYHIVWITKYRYKILKGDIAHRLIDLIKGICSQYQVEIIRGSVGKDHVHLYLQVPPSLALSRLVQYLKGKTSRKLQIEYPSLKKRYWGKHLWGIGYFIRTSGNVTDETIKTYIEQQGEDDKFGDFQVQD